MRTNRPERSFALKGRGARIAGGVLLAALMLGAALVMLHPAGPWSGTRSAWADETPTTPPATETTPATPAKTAAAPADSTTAPAPTEVNSFTPSTRETTTVAPTKTEATSTTTEKTSAPTGTATTAKTSTTSATKTSRHMRRSTTVSAPAKPASATATSASPAQTPVIGSTAKTTPTATLPASRTPQTVAARPAAVRPGSVTLRAGATPVLPGTTVHPVPAVPRAHLEDRIAYQYNALGRRDPFQPLIDGGFIGNDVGGDAPPDVGGLKVVGIVWGANDKFALCEDARGNSMVLRTGDKVMNGVVSGLTREALLVSITADGQTESVAIPLTRKGENSNGNR